MLPIKPVRWIGRSREHLRSFPGEARREIGYALQFAQMGDKHSSAKPLKGFGGAGVLEIIEDHIGATYRVVYTVKFLGGCICSSCFPKEVQERYQDSQTGIRPCKETFNNSGKR